MNVTWSFVLPAGPPDVTIYESTDDGLLVSFTDGSTKLVPWSEIRFDGDPQGLKS